jgi:hypothetical protein
MRGRVPRRVTRRYRGSVNRRILLTLLVGTLAIAACGSSSSSGSPATTAEKGHPAGSQPSASAKMICSTEAQTDIAASLGVKATVSTPTWANDVYACNYTYPTGTIALSVKEYNTAKQTDTAYVGYAKSLGRLPTVVSFGEGAFITTNGSVVVRKDFKVLLIDVSKLPQKFGNPLQDRSNVALSVAATVMSCWTGE